MFITADWHLTDKPQDEYRWRVFKMLRCFDLPRDPTPLIIAGDVTDAKDCHSSKLVNRLCERLEYLVQQGFEIYILRGNHDYNLEGNRAFFEFLGHFNRIHFIAEPRELKINGVNVCFLPHVSDPARLYTNARRAIREADLVVVHQCFQGARDAVELKGCNPKLLEDAKLVVAGDVHKPQKVGKNITYVGAPYCIRFGDDYFTDATPPRFLYYSASRGKLISHDLYRDYWIRKLTITRQAPGVEGLSKYRLFRSDQVKFRLEVRQADVHILDAWRKELAGYMKKAGVIITGFESVITDMSHFKPSKSGEGIKSPRDIFKGYNRQSNASNELVAYGQSIMEGRK